MRYPRCSRWRGGTPPRRGVDNAEFGNGRHLSPPVPRRVTADGPQPTLKADGVNAPGVPVQQRWRRVMTTMVVDSAVDSAVTAMTVGRLRDLLDALADGTSLHIGVYGHHHFNSCLGTMPVTSARVAPIPGGVIVLLHVPGTVSYTHLRAHETRHD